MTPSDLISAWVPPQDSAVADLAADTVRVFDTVTVFDTVVADIPLLRFPTLPLLLTVIVAGLLLVTTAFLIARFGTTLASDSPRVEGHWGGFGNALGGWRISGSLAYLLASVAFGALFVVVSLTAVELAREASAAAPPDTVLVRVVDPPAPAPGGAGDPAAPPDAEGPAGQDNGS